MWIADEVVFATKITTSKPVFIRLRTDIKSIIAIIAAMAATMGAKIFVIIRFMETFNEAITLPSMEGTER